MNTPAHLIFGLAAFGKAHAPRVTGAAIVGALIPDLSLYVLAGTHLFILGTDPNVVFGELYFSNLWQSIFRVDNSFLVWGGVLALGLALRRAWVVALAGAALLHIGLDFPLHHDDGRAHFWPLTDWVFQSPVSYWDRDHHAGIVAPIEMAVTFLLCVMLWRRFDWPAGFADRTARLRVAVRSWGGLVRLPLTLLAWVWGVGLRGLVVALGAAQLLPGLVWLFFFGA